MLRRLLLSLMFAVVGISAFPAKRLMIELTNGTKVYYSFSDYKPIIPLDCKEIKPVSPNGNLIHWKD